MSIRKTIPLITALILVTGLLVSSAPAQEDRQREEKESAVEQQMRQRRLDELAQKARQLRQDVEATLQPKAKAAEGKEEALKIFVNGQEVRLGSGASVVVEGGRPFLAAGAGNPSPDKLRQLERERAELEKALERVRAQERELRERLEAPRPRGEAEHPRGEGAKEGQEGIKVILDGREVTLTEGKLGEGRAAVVSSGRPGQPGAAVIREEEGPEGRRVFVTNAPRPGGQFGMPGAPAPGAARPPLPGSPWQAAPANPAVRPNVAAGEQMQQAQQMMMGLSVYQQVTFDPGKAGLAAIGAIKDDLARSPVGAIRVLEASLKSIRTPGLRTAIHLALKDLYKAQGKEEMVLEHLRAVLEESDAQLQGGRPAASASGWPAVRPEGGALNPAPMMRREGLPGGPPPRERVGQTDQKDNDRDEEDED